MTADPDPSYAPLILRKDVFISTRRTGKPALEQLRTYLQPDVSKYDWDDVGRFPGKHPEITNTMISRSRGAIIIIGANYLTPQPDSEEAAQYAEIEKILETQKDHKATYKVSVLLIQDSAGEPNADAYEKHFKKKHPNLLIAGFSVEGLPDAVDGKVKEGWFPVLEKVSAGYKAWKSKYFGASENDVIDEGDGDTGHDDDAIRQPPQQWTSERFALAEQAYLHSAIEAWREGRSLGDAADTPGPFSFDARRFIVLNAREIGSASSEHAGDKLSPITKWLFNADQHPPYAIRGPAGCGHTCTLSITAAAMAAQLDADLAAKCADIPESINAPARALAKTTQFVPVFMRAQRIVKIIRAPKAAMPSLADAVFAAVAGRLTGDAGDGPTSVEMQERMLARPYALFIDDLDRLAPNDETMVLRALNDTHRTLKGRAPFKVIASGHAVSAERVDVTIDVKLERPNAEQREAFFGSYTRTSRGEDVKEDIAEAAKHLPSSATLFDTPLLLNALCWGASQPSIRFDESKGQVVFLRQIIDQLLTTMLKKAPDLPTKEKVIETLGALSIASLTRSLDDDEVERIAAKSTAKPTDLINFLVEKAHILERRPTEIRKRHAYNVRGLFADYLAAEQLAENHADAESILPNRGAVAYRSWRQAIAFAAAIHLDRRDEGAALALLDGLRERGELSERPADQADWFRCAAAGLASLASVQAEPTPARRSSIQSAIKTLAQAKSWSPRQRSEAILELSTAVRHPRSAEKARKAVNALCSDLLNIKDHWVAIPGFKHPGGDASFKVAGLPMLVAQYAEFVADKKNADQSLASDIGRAEPETGADIWAQISTMPMLPIVGLTFEEAVHYCAWLNKTLRDKGPLRKGEIIRLPTEAEWEAIADAVCNTSHPYWWGAEDPEEGDLSRINWRGANIGAPTAPGAFAPYIAADLYDFGSNVSVWTTPHRGAGQKIWPPRLAPGENPEVCGANFASQMSRLPYSGEKATPPSHERWRTTGVRLVKTTCDTGWN